MKLLASISICFLFIFYLFSVYYFTYFTSIIYLILFLLISTNFYWLLFLISQIRSLKCTCVRLWSTNLIYQKKIRIRPATRRSNATFYSFLVIVCNICKKRFCIVWCKLLQFIASSEPVFITALCRTNAEYCCCLLSTENVNICLVYLVHNTIN